MTALAAGPVEAPALKKGKFVCAVPSSFDPPTIGRRGMDEINAEASKLHYPFYVVLTQELNGAGDPDVLAKAASDGLAADWAARGGFKTATSQIFVLSYNPRKYAFLAGSKFKNELGFEKSAHDPYLELFKQFMRGPPKDPVGGIIAMMTAVDEYLWD